MKPSVTLIFELKQHAPFTAIVTVIVIRYSLNITIADHAFHILHPVHVTVSAINTGLKPSFH